MKMGRFGKKRELLKEDYKGEAVIKKATLEVYNSGSQYIQLLLDCNGKNAFVNLAVTDKNGEEIYMNVNKLEEIEKELGKEFSDTDSKAMNGTITVDLVAEEYKDFINMKFRMGTKKTVKTTVKTEVLIENL